MRLDELKDRLDPRDARVVWNVRQAASDDAAGEMLFQTGIGVLGRIRSALGEPKLSTSYNVPEHTPLAWCVKLAAKIRAVEQDAGFEAAD